MTSNKVLTKRINMEYLLINCKLNISRIKKKTQKNFKLIRAVFKQMATIIVKNLQQM